MTSPHPLELLVRKLEGFARLSDDDRAAIRALPLVIRVVEPSSYIIREGDRAKHCVVLVAGFAYRQKITGDGHRQILSIHIPGDAVDLQNLNLEISDHSVQALTRATIGVVPQSDMRKLAEEHPAVRQAMETSSLVEASIFREWILNVGRRDARARIAHLLCEFAVRLDLQGLAPEYGFELPMTQEQLADCTGLTPIHVNRTLKALEADGLIRRDRRQVSIPDWKALRDAGDFNSLYLHLDQRRELDA